MCKVVILKPLLVFFVLLLTAGTVLELLMFVRLSPFTADRLLACGVQVLRDRWDWKLLPWLTECSKVSPLSTRLQPVRQFKQGLLIVNNVKVIDVSTRLWAALLDDAISWRGRKLLSHSKYRFVPYNDRFISNRNNNKHLWTDPCDLSDTAGGIAPRPLSCAGYKDRHASVTETTFFPLLKEYKSL